MVDSSDNVFHASVYHKPTDHGTCLNANSECVEKYKNSVIINYLNRAYKVTDDWQEFHREVVRIKQILVNNNYSNTIIDSLTNKFLQQKQSPSNISNEIKHKLNVYYNSQMHRNYKVEERVIKNIVYSNTKTINPNDKLNVIFYYKNIKASNLAMKNNLTDRAPSLQQTGVVYCFTCPSPHCKADQYIGLTQTTLSRRLTMHAQTGSIFQHFAVKHSSKPTRSELVDNTTIIARADNRSKLTIKEAILILKRSPSINKQFDNFKNILKLHKHRSEDVAPPTLHNRTDITHPTAPPLSQNNILNQVPYHNSDGLIASTNNEIVNPFPPPLSQDVVEICANASPKLDLTLHHVTNNTEKPFNHVLPNPTAPPLSQDFPDIYVNAPCRIQYHSNLNSYNSDSNTGNHIIHENVQPSTGTNTNIATMKNTHISIISPGSQENQATASCQRSISQRVRSLSRQARKKN